MKHIIICSHTHTQIIEFRSASKSTWKGIRTKKIKLNFALNENETAHVTKTKSIPTTKRESVMKCAQRSTGFLIFSGATFNGMYQIK